MSQNSNSNSDRTNVVAISCCVRPPASGLTLLELILALVLMSTLLMATWSLLGIFRDRFEKSQQQTEEWQLIRSVQQTLEADLRSCAVRRVRRARNMNRSDAFIESGDSPSRGDVANGATTQSNGPTDSSSVGAVDSDSENRNFEVSGKTTQDSEMLDTSDIEPMDSQESPFDLSANQMTASLERLIDEAWLDPRTMFVGNTQGMILDIVAAPSPGSRRPPDREPPLDRAELPDIQRRIIYAFSDPRTAAVQDRLPGLIRCQLTVRQLTVLQHIGTGQQDLMRLLRPMIPLGSVAISGMEEALVSNDRDPSVTVARDSLTTGSQLTDAAVPIDPRLQEQHRGLGLDRQVDYVPEVALMLLRYYDGADWLPDWDSRRTGRLPVAVEVRFQLRSELPTTSAAEVVEGEFRADSDQALENPLMLADSSSLDPMDDQARSAITRPPQDHRFVIHIPRVKTWVEPNMFELDREGSQTNPANESFGNSTGLELQPNSNAPRLTPPAPLNSPPGSRGSTAMPTFPRLELSGARRLAP